MHVVMKFLMTLQRVESDNATDSCINVYYSGKSAAFLNIVFGNR